MNNTLKSINTIATLLMVGILVFYPASTLHLPWWVGFALGYIGSAVAIVLIKDIWKAR